MPGGSAGYLRTGRRRRRCLTGPAASTGRWTCVVLRKVLNALRFCAGLLHSGTLIMNDFCYESVTAADMHAKHRTTGSEKKSGI